MSAPGPHNRLIREAARAALSPLGVRQRGRSRVWLDDHGWWLGVVEFQPSGFSRGTYLNVAAMWLWERTDHMQFSFRRPGRDLPFLSANADFANAVQAVASRAAAELRGLRAQFPDVASVAATLRSGLSAGGRPQYDAAVAQALAGQLDVGRGALAELTVAGQADYPWMTELRRQARALADTMVSRAEFLRAVMDIINTTRGALHLEPMGSDIA